MNFNTQTATLLQSIAADAGIETLSQEELEKCHAIIVENCEGDLDEYYYVAKDYFNN